MIRTRSCLLSPLFYANILAHLPPPLCRCDHRPTSRRTSRRSLYSPPPFKVYLHRQPVMHVHVAATLSFPFVFSFGYLFRPKTTHPLDLQTSNRPWHFRWHHSHRHLSLHRGIRTSRCLWLRLCYNRFRTSIRVDNCIRRIEWRTFLANWRQIGSEIITCTSTIIRGIHVYRMRLLLFILKAPIFMLPKFVRWQHACAAWQPH